ncbi:MAG: hypothetical protein IT317_19295 [Anaerolineales bacterium]|nr:hypothetical protein [Anaerolineales bacterium]
MDTLADSIADTSVTVIRFIIGFVLLVSGLLKLRDKNQFLFAVLGYAFLPRKLGGVIAMCLPFVELGEGVLLLSGWQIQVSTTCAFVLLLLFSWAMSISLVQGRNHSCGCFHALTPIRWRLVYRNIAIMGLLLIVLMHGELGGSRLIIPSNSQDSLSSLSVFSYILALTWLIAILTTIIFHKTLKVGKPTGN